MRSTKIIAIIVLMSLSLIGIIALQAYWISHAFDLKEEQFNSRINQVMHSVISQVETHEAAQMLSNNLFEFQLSPSDFSFQSPNTTITTTIDSVRDTTVFSRQVTEDGNIIERVEIHADTSIGQVKITERRETSADGMSQQMEVMIEAGTQPNYTWTEEQHHERFHAKQKQLQKVMQRMLVDFNRVRPIQSRLDSETLNTIIQNELTNNGLNLDYEFGVVQAGRNPRLVMQTADFKTDMVKQSYQASLFPNDVFNSRNFLLLNFPKQDKYIISSLWWLLLIALVFTGIIVLTFTGSVYLILQQKKLAEIKNDFINNMTHEFKTPISTIALAADALTNPRVLQNNEQVDRYTGIIKDENRKMNQHVENVLQMALLDKEKFELKLEDLTVHEIVRDCTEKFRLKIASKQGNIHLDLKADDSTVSGDSILIMTVFNNLIDNAIKYSKEVPNITISSMKSAGNLLISISDEGLGMNKDTLKKIFDKFFRVNTGNVHNVKGFGLGLNYVKAIVLAHNGTIDVESEPNQGSTFTLTLPILIK